jgi:cyclohexanecarboxylate-CoA ligase
MACRADGAPRVITYTELAGRVERFAGALDELGVPPGQVVACQLPNWWQADEWEGFEHAAALQAIAPMLPELRHRVMIGESNHGEIDFRSAFEQTPREERHPVALGDAVEEPDRVAMVLLTSSISGEAKGVELLTNPRRGRCVGWLFG